MKGRFRYSTVLLCLFVITIFLSVLIVSIPLFVHAGEEHAGSSGRHVWDLIWRAINFFILLGMLVYLLKTPLKNFINQRQQSIKDSLQKAEEAREEARKKYQEMEERLLKASQEIEEITRMLSEQGNAEKRKIIENAERESERIRQQAQFMAEQEFKKARAALRKEAVDLAAEMAAALLKEKLTERDHIKLVDEYLEKVVKRA